MNTLAGELAPTRHIAHVVLVCRRSLYKPTEGSPPPTEMVGCAGPKPLSPREALARRSEGGGVSVSLARAGRSQKGPLNCPGFDGGCILWEDVAHVSIEAADA
jgi:hypothetical protein